MRFLDTNVLVYALLEPRRALTPLEMKLIADAKVVLHRIERGEKVMCSVVHVSEFVNIIQHRKGVVAACEFLNSLIAQDNIKIAGVERRHYQIALEIAHESHVSINDCIAVVLMAEHGVSEIYSFDKDFDALGIKRVT